MCVSYTDRFTFNDIGGFDRQSDGGVFSNSIFGASFENRYLIFLLCLKQESQPFHLYWLVMKHFLLKTISCGPILEMIYHVCRKLPHVVVILVLFLF